MVLVSHDFVAMFYIKTIDLFQVNVSFLNPLKTSENLWFSNVFRGYTKGSSVNDNKRALSVI